MEITLYRPNLPINTNIEKMMDHMLYRKLKYRLSEMIFEKTWEIEELKDAMQRAVSACNANGVDIGQNFKCLYLGSREGLVKDWLLSSFARNLIILNMNPRHPHVGRLQTELLLRLENT